jgi:SAM-dependent methyltransferase
VLNQFNQYSLYYDIIYRDKNYDQESEFVMTYLNKYAPEAKHILELGSGSGNHAAYLCSKNLRVTGIELSEEMLRISQLKNINGFNAINGSIEHFDLKEKMNAAISLFHVMSYLNTNASLESCLKSLNQHLNAGAPFIFDFWYSPAVFHEQPSVRVKRWQTEEYELVRISEPIVNVEKDIVTVKFEIFIKDHNGNLIANFEEEHHMRHFSLPFIAYLAEKTGFEMVDSFEFGTGKKLSENTWGACVVLIKK